MKRILKNNFSKIFAHTQTSPRIYRIVNTVDVMDQKNISASDQNRRLKLLILPALKVI